MLPFFLLALLARAASSAQLLTSFPIDDTSLLGLDQGESALDPLFDDNWSTSPSYDPGSVSDLSISLFEEPGTDPSAQLWDDNGSISPGGEGGADTTAISIANGCPSNPTQASKVRSRRELDQCFNGPPVKITFEEMINEQIKRKWCSGIPWLDFGNIPVARFTDSLIFPVHPGALPDVPLTTIPLSGYFNVMRAVLRKWIYPAPSFQPNGPCHD